MFKKSNLKVKQFFINGMFINFFIFILIFTLVIILISLPSTQLIGIIFLGLFYFVQTIALYLVWSYKRSDLRTKLNWLFLFLFPGSIYIYLKAGFVPRKKRNKLVDLRKFEKELEALNIDASKIEPIHIIQEKYNKLIKDLQTAKHFINFQYFIINDGIVWNNIKEILIQKQRAGVKVRVLIDYIGSIQTNHHAFKELKKENIEFIEFNKIHNFRNTGWLNYRSHNKLVIIDNKIGYTGGANIGDDYASLYSKYGNWEDLNVRVEGEIVNAFNNLFISQWHLATNNKIKQEKPVPIKAHIPVKLQSDGPQYNETRFLNTLIENINSATKSIRIVTPYFILPKSLEDALRNARNRNVDIEIVTAGRPDKKTAFWLSHAFVQRVNSFGVKVYRMNNIFIHSKFYIFDDKTILTGTTNLDYRALFIHFESNLIIQDDISTKELINKFNKIFDEYLLNATLMKLNSLEWNWHWKLRWVITKLFSTIF